MYVSSIHLAHNILIVDHLPPLPPPPEPLIIQALTYLLQPQTFPTLVCCNMGRHRSGTVVGCYRKLQRWALSSILEEYRRYAGAKVRVLNEQVSYNEVGKMADDSLSSCSIRIWWPLRRRRSRCRPRLDVRENETKESWDRLMNQGDEEEPNPSGAERCSNRSTIKQRHQHVSSSQCLVGIIYSTSTRKVHRTLRCPAGIACSYPISHREDNVRCATAV